MIVSFDCKGEYKNIEWTNPKGKWLQKRIIWLRQWELGVIAFWCQLFWLSLKIPTCLALSCEFNHGQRSNLLPGILQEPSMKQTKRNGLTVVLRSSSFPNKCQRHDTLQAPPQSTQRWVVDPKHLKGSTLVQWTGNSLPTFSNQVLIGRSLWSWRWRVSVLFDLKVKNYQRCQSTTNIYPSAIN